MYMRITYTVCIYLGVCLNLKVTVAQVTLHSELVDGGGVVVTHLCLLGIIAYPHTHVRATPITPDVVRKLKPRYQQQANEIRTPVHIHTTVFATE